jgi:SAM-dependent methyltransferase
MHVDGVKPQTQTQTQAQARVRVRVRVPRDRPRHEFVSQARAGRMEGFAVRPCRTSLPGHMSPICMPPMSNASSALEEFLGRLRLSLERGDFERLVLAGYRGDEPELQRILVRQVALKGRPHLSFVYRHRTRDVTKNCPVDDGLARIQGLLQQEFRNAHLHAGGQEIQWAVSKKGRATLRVGASAGGEQDAGAQPGAAKSPAAHNREKRRLLSIEEPFLSALCITDAQHRLIPSMARKWKQINKFLEVFAPAWERSPLAARGAGQPVRVLDFGAGKGYLTFAMHHYLHRHLGLEAQVIGVELRPDLVRLCNDAAQQLGLEGLSFEAGDVHSRPSQAVDVMIALHACDVATDYAMHAGIRAGATIIMCAPCCHKQLRPQLLSPHPLRPILQHGVHLGQEAEMLTDGLRALLLQACGYDAQVFEFISLEHTNKNKMILAVKQPRPDPAQRQRTLEQIREVEAFYGIKQQCLQSLLQADGLIEA